MKGITKEAMKANGRSRKCATCPFHGLCTPIILKVCSDAFIEGFKKGAKRERQQKIEI